MSNVFYYEDGQDNLYDEQGMRVYDPMKDVLTEVNDSNIILETLTNHDKERERFIDKMIECAQEKGATARVARSMGINVRNAQRWWKQYREDGTMPYKKSSEMKGRPSTFTNEHNSYLIELIDDDSQIIRAGRSPGSVLLDMTDRSESPVQLMALIAKQFPSRIAVATTKEGSRKIAEINFDPSDPALGFYLVEP
ncbi:hypothetical protein G6F43_012583 [Rhizopus delemar]|nr:hypothetical protein G6F43_012583 [Rhizopus delemar]